MKNINWINRLKNKYTLTALVGAVLLFIKQVAEAFGYDASATLDAAQDAIGAIITFLVTIGVVVNPNTKGGRDAGIDMELKAPRDENDPNFALAWEVYTKKQKEMAQQERKEIEEERAKINEDLQQRDKQHKQKDEIIKQRDKQNQDKEEELKQRELAHQEKERELEEMKSENKPVEEPIDNVDVVDGIEGKEISNGDIQDEIELNNQTAQDTFGDVDNEIFGDSAEPQKIGNDTDEEYREKQADADIRGTDIRG